MKEKVIWIIALLSGLLIALLLTHSPHNEEEGVLLLGDEDFEAALEKHPTILVEFFIHGCGACEALAPEYTRAASLLQHYGIKLAKVNSEASPVLSEKFNIEGYPTLLFFKDKVKQEDTVGDTAEEIISFMKQQMLPPVLIRNTQTEIDTLRSVERVLIVMFSQQKYAGYKIFQKVAKAMPQFTFVLCENEEIKKEYGSPSVVLFKQFDDLRNDFTDKVTKDTLVNFINSHSLPWVMPFDNIAVEHIMYQSHNALFLFVSEEDEPTYLPMLTTLGKSMNSELAFTYVDLNENENLEEHFSVSGEDMPFALLYNAGEDLRYLLKDTITEEYLRQSIQKFKNNELEAYFKTEEPPLKTHENGVRVLVGTTFDEIVKDPNYDVMVEFYAPWCGYCQQLAPEYEKIAKKYAESNVILAKIDGTKNQIPGVRIEGYPTLLFYPADDKEGLDYPDDYTSRDITRFINKNAATLTEKKNKKKKKSKSKKKN